MMSAEEWKKFFKQKIVKPLTSETRAISSTIGDQLFLTARKYLIFITGIMSPVEYFFDCLQVNQYAKCTIVHAQMILKFSTCLVQEKS
jgi:hypothetical protein